MHESRVLREIRNACGTLTSKAGETREVRFSLTIRQDFADGVPGLREASGRIEFEDGGPGWIPTDGSTQTLVGNGIKAEIFLTGGDRFEVAHEVQGL